MSHENAEQILSEFGISPEAVITSASSYLQAHLREARSVLNLALSSDEMNLLRLGGVSPLQVITKSMLYTPDLLGNYALLEGTSTDGKGVQAKLGVSASRIRQLDLDRKLYSFTSATGSKLYPLWQFHTDAKDNTSTILGLQEVLDAIDCSTHPLVISRFMTEPHLDLESDASDTEEGISPRDWLITNHPVTDVVHLATGL